MKLYSLEEYYKQKGHPEKYKEAKEKWQTQDNSQKTQTSY